MAENAIISLDTKDFDRKFRELIKEHPNYIRNAAKTVNREVIKDVKRVMQSRGYLAHKPMSWGDAGFRGKGNIYQDVNKDLSGKLWFSSRAYHLKFVEYGANVRPQHKKYLTFKIDGQFYKSEGFTLPAQPLLQPTADSYWKTDKAKNVMEKYLQKQYDKLTGAK